MKKLRIKLECGGDNAGVSLPTLITAKGEQVTAHEIQGALDILMKGIPAARLSSLDKELEKKDVYPAPHDDDDDEDEDLA